MPDFAFVQDGTREGEYIRLEMHEWLVDMLNQKNKHYVAVKGSQEQRMMTAIAAINAILKFPALETP
jgi:nicotinamide riboside kinase